MKKLIPFFLLNVFLIVPAIQAKITFDIHFIDQPNTGLHQYPEAKTMAHEAIQELLDCLDHPEHNFHINFDFASVPPEGGRLAAYVAKKIQHIHWIKDDKTEDCFLTKPQACLYQDLCDESEHQTIKVTIDEPFDFKYQDPTIRNIAYNFKSIIGHEVIHALGFVGNARSGDLIIQSLFKLLTVEDENNFMFKSNYTQFPIVVRPITKTNSVENIHIENQYPFDNCHMVSGISPGDSKTLCQPELLALASLGYNVKHSCLTQDPIPVVLVLNNESGLEAESSLLKSGYTKGVSPTLINGKTILGTYTPNSLVDLSLSNKINVNIPLRRNVDEEYHVCVDDIALLINVSQTYDTQNKEHIVSIHITPKTDVETCNRRIDLTQHASYSDTIDENNHLLIVLYKTPAVTELGIDITLINQEEVRFNSNTPEHLSIYSYLQGYKKIGYEGPNTIYRITQNGAYVTNWTTSTNAKDINLVRVYNRDNELCGYIESIIELRTDCRAKTITMNYLPLESVPYEL